MIKIMIMIAFNNQSKLKKGKKFPIINRIREHSTLMKTESNVNLGEKNKRLKKNLCQSSRNFKNMMNSKIKKIKS